MFGGVLNRLLSKGGGKAASRLASEYGDDVLRSVATEYGDDAARNTLNSLLGDAAGATSKKSAIGDALVKASDVGLNAPMALTKKEMRDVSPSAHETIGRLFDRTGMSNIDDLRSLAKELTGGENSFLDEATDAIRTNLGKGNIVDLNDLGPQLREVRDSMDKIVGRQFDEADPVRKAKILRGMASDLRKSATKTEGSSVKSKYFEDLGREIDNRIDANVDPKYVNQVYDDVGNEFLYRSQKALREGNKSKSEAYERLAKEFMETPGEERSVAGLRSSKKDFVDISEIGKLNDRSKGGGSFSRVVSQVPVAGKLIDAVAAQPVERASQKVGEVTRKVGQAFQRGEAQPILKKGAAIGAGGLGLAAMMGGSDDSSKNKSNMLDTTGGSGTPGLGASGPANSSSNAQTDSALGGSTLLGAQEKEPTVGGYTRSQLEDGYVKALMDNNPKAAQAIGSIIDLMDKNEARALNVAKVKNSSKSKATDDDKKQNAISTLNTLMGVYNEGGGGQGIAGGTLTNLLNKATGGGYNPAAETYAAQSRGAAAKIIKAMGDSGQLSDRDVQAALDMLPKNTDDNKVAKKKIDNLMAILQAK